MNREGSLLYAVSTAAKKHKCGVASKARTSRPITAREGIEHTQLVAIAFVGTEGRFMSCWPLLACSHSEAPASLAAR